MPDGTSRTATVDDGFSQLSPPDQADMVSRMRQSAMGAGDSDNSWGAAVQAGAHDAVTSLGNLAHAGGAVLRAVGLPDTASRADSAGDWLQKNAPTAPAGNNPGAAMVNDAKQGNYGSAAADAGKALVRGAIGYSPALAAGLVTDGAGAAVAGAQALGDDAAARQANNGEKQMSAGDVAAAAPGAVATAALGRFGMSSPAAEITNPLIRGATRAAKGAVAGATGVAVNEAASTAGTDKGLQVDPTQIAAGAAAGGLGGAALEIPAAARAAAKTTAMRALAARTDIPDGPEDQQSVIRVNNAMNDARSALTQANGSAPHDTVVANNVKSQLQTDLIGAVNAWRKSGAIDANQATDLRTLVNRQALPHNNTIAADIPGVRSLFDSVDDISQDAGGRLSPADVTQFKNGVRDLNTLSNQSFLKNTTGPLQALGGTLGKYGSAAAAVMTGHPWAAAAPFILSRVNPAEHIGSAVGRIGDQALGLNVPPVVLQAMGSANALKAAGIDPSTLQSSLPGVQALRNGMGPSTQPDPATGLAPSPIPVNTPIRAGTPTPTAQPQPSTFKPNTPEDVRAAVAQDDATGQSAAPAAGVAAPQARPVWSNYVANGDPAITHDVVMQALARAAQNNSINPQLANFLQTHPGSYEGAYLRPIQQEAQRAVYGDPAGQAAAVGIPTQDVDAQGSPIRSRAAYDNSRAGYHSSVQTFVHQHPELADITLAIAQAPSQAAKTSLARAYVASHPEALGKFPAWLLTQGPKGTPQ
jgi:hypothetical protein